MLYQRTRSGIGGISKARHAGCEAPRPLNRSGSICPCHIHSGLRTTSSIGAARTIKNPASRCGQIPTPTIDDGEAFRLHALSDSARVSWCFRFEVSPRRCNLFSLLLGCSNSVGAPDIPDAHKALGCPNIARANVQERRPWILYGSVFLGYPFWGWQKRKPKGKPSRHVLGGVQPLKKRKGERRGNVLGT